MGDTAVAVAVGLGADMEVGMEADSEVVMEVEDMAEAVVAEV